LTERLEKIFKPEPARPAPTPVENQPPKLDLQPVTRNVPKNLAAQTQPDDSQQKLRAAARNAARSLQKNFTPGTTIDMPGNSSVAQANYASIVRSVYDQAWMLPDNVASENENVKVSVTIASDGTVINARILSPSDDASLNASVQRTLERVTFVAPFLTGMTEQEWTRTISFNPETKKMSE
jgi:TonB family protein